jgi:signal transduction histidine kinase
MYFSEDELPENKKLMLFRIIQEQLNNIIKHSGAQQVQIILNNDEGDTTLEIKDNGKGFDPLQSKIGLGLTNIKNRCELFGGRMEIKTSLGNGCTLKLHIPSSSKE